MVQKRNIEDAYKEDSNITNEDDYYGKIIRVEDSTEDSPLQTVRDLDSSETEEEDSNIMIVDSEAEEEEYDLSNQDVEIEMAYRADYGEEFSTEPLYIHDMSSNFDYSESCSNFDSSEDSSYECESSGDKSDESEVEVVESTFREPFTNEWRDSMIRQQINPEMIILESIINSAVESSYNFRGLNLPVMFSSENSGPPVRFEEIDDQFIDDLKDKVKKMVSLANSNTLNMIVRDLIRLCSFYSREQIFHIRDLVRNKLADDPHIDPDISNMLILIYNWRRLDYPRSGQTSKKKKYQSVMYKNLMNVKHTSCIICYEEFKPTVMCSTMNCQHVFHTRCLSEWLKESNCCPFCRVSSKDR